MKYKHETRAYRQGARAEAAEATGKRIVEAFLDRMLKQFYDEITLEQTAQDAGVTVMTVVRRFGSKDELLASAVKLFTDRVHATRGMPLGSVSGAVENLIKDYDNSGDGVIRLLALEERFEVIQRVLVIGRTYHRQWVTNVFTKELDKLKADSRERAIDALVIATDVYTWKLLRRDMKRKVSEVAEIMAKMIQSVLAGYVK